VNLKIIILIAVGFEPTKHIARDLESLPFDRSGTLPLIVKIIIPEVNYSPVILPYVGLEPTTFRLEV
tara:strand:+ start:210 stop:410 length:201 start_codon:yes stop_codon:yes gene_type:complete